MTGSASTSVRFPPGHLKSLRYIAASALTLLAVAGYLVIAIGVGCLPTLGTLSRIGVASFAILAATHWARRIPTPKGATTGASLSSFQAMAARTVIPAIYGLVLGVVQRMAGPSWAGLVSTFPSMSLVVLAVTHLEAGPGGR